jgi:hypothetical protein
VLCGRLCEQASGNATLQGSSFFVNFAHPIRKQNRDARFAGRHYIQCMKALLIVLAACGLLLASQRPAQAQVSWGFPLPFPFTFYNFNQGYYSQPYYGRAYYGQGYYCRPGYCTPSRRAYYYRPRYYYRPQYYYPQSYFGPSYYGGPGWGGYGGW